MPNWCSNIVKINFETKTEKKVFKSAVSNEESRFSFDKIKPEPDLSDGWEQMLWRVKHWGTKWEPRPTGADNTWKIEEGDHWIKYQFDKLFNACTQQFYLLVRINDAIP